MKHFPPKRMLVAADLSAPSLSALEAAKVLARRWDASLEIVHVQNSPLIGPWTGPEGIVLPAPPPAELERDVDEQLRKAVAGFPEDRVDVRGIQGWPPNQLADLAGVGGADMVVIGTHGYAGLDRLVFGSVAEAVVRRARVPVLAVHERRTPIRLARVLAPWNGRPYATRALRYARELARGLGAELCVMHVREPGRLCKEDDAALRRRLKTLLDGSPYWTLRIYGGDARERIMKLANSGEFGLLVLSAHRRAFFSDFVLGSTVERVLRHSQIPVLAVPSGGVSRRSLVSRPSTWIAGKIFSA